MKPYIDIDKVLPALEVRVGLLIKLDGFLNDVTFTLTAGALEVHTGNLLAHELLRLKLVLNVQTIREPECEKVKCRSGHE